MIPLAALDQHPLLSSYQRRSLDTMMPCDRRAFLTAFRGIGEGRSLRSLISGGTKREARFQFRARRKVSLASNQRSSAFASVATLVPRDELAKASMSIHAAPAERI